MALHRNNNNNSGSTSTSTSVSVSGGASIQSSALNGDPAIRLFGTKISPPPTTITIPIRRHDDDDDDDPLPFDTRLLPPLHHHPPTMSPSPPPAAAAAAAAESTKTALNTLSGTRRKDREFWKEGLCSREDCDSIPQEGDQAHKQNSPENVEGANQKPDESIAAECSSGSKEKVSQSLPCPRCNSTKTKFCYFNNYNVNQPRHFCKNCHRYWTAGGKVRNVPETGRRKNKTSCLQNQSASASSGGVPASELGMSPTDRTQLSPHISSSSKNRLELMTDGDSPLHDSVVTAPALQDQRNLFDTSRDDSLKQPSFSSPSLVIVEDSEIPGNAPVERGEVSGNVPIVSGPYGIISNPLPILQGFPRPLSVYPHEIGWKGMACGGAGGGQAIVPFDSPAMTEVPRFCTPNSVFPLSILSHRGQDAGMGNFELSSNLSQGPSTSNTSSPAHCSRSLGKHSRDVSSFQRDSVEDLSLPKTTRLNGQELGAADATRATSEN